MEAMAVLLAGLLPAQSACFLTQANQVETLSYGWFLFPKRNEG